MAKIFGYLAIFTVVLFSQSAHAQSVCSVQFTDTNTSGGGFQSDVTITEDGLTVYSSADVSGISKSIDGGLRYEARNNGLESYKVASLAITPDNDQILYAGIGDKGASGGLFRSYNGGKSWKRTKDGVNAKFAGNHSSSKETSKGTLPKGHARSNGDLIVIDTGSNPKSHIDDIVIAGSYKDGVRIFKQGGDKEVSAVNTNGFVRSVAFNPGLPNTVFAAIQFADSGRDSEVNGIYQIDYTDIDNPSSVLVHKALRPEGLTVLENGLVFAALGTEGIVKYNGKTWKSVNEGLSIDNQYRQWTAVTGYVSDGNVIIYAGTNNLGGQDGENYSNIWKTINGGRTWTPLVDASVNVSDTIYGQEDDWWFRVDAFQQAGLGRKNSVVSSIDVARGPNERHAFDDIIYVSGRGGIWKSNNGGKTWAPAVNNMQVTANNGVAVNPNEPDQVVVANTDFVALETNSGFKGNDMSRDKPLGAESKAYDTIFDTKSNEIILGAGDRDTNNPGAGEVYVKKASSLGSPSGSGWKNTNLVSATSSNNGRVRAVTYGYHNGTRYHNGGTAPHGATTQTILAAVEGEGVYRYHKGHWKKSTGVKIGSTKRSNFIWPDNRNSGVVYLLDLSAGLYRSQDGGKTWKDIWPGMKFRNNDFYNTGYIAADDNDPTTLYISAQGSNGKFNIYRLTGANVGVFDQSNAHKVTDISKHSADLQIQRPGPLAFGSNGELWVTQQQDSKKSISPGIYFMKNPKTDSSFKIATSDRYRYTVVSPSGMDISKKGDIYISQNGHGVVKMHSPCTRK